MISLQVQKPKDSAVVMMSDEDEIEVLEENIKVRPQKIKRFLQLACFFRLRNEKPLGNQVKNPSSAVGHGRGVSAPYFQQSQVKNSSVGHGRGRGRGRGQGHQVPYVPPPVKQPFIPPKKVTPPQCEFAPPLVAPVPVQVKRDIRKTKVCRTLTHS